MRLTVLLILTIVSAAEAQDRASWMREARFGVMTHYLADWIARNHGQGRQPRGRETKEPMTIERWNKLVDEFDVDGLAKQLASAGAGYYQITIGQNSGYYLAPNAAYDRLTGIQPSKLSRRDLVADLHAALAKQGIRLMVYLPAGAPNGDAVARKALEWQNGAYRNAEFQLKWEQVIWEWSMRWDKKISGWWFDGCYWPNTMYRMPEAPNFASFAAAARAGNPESALAFNPGVFDRIFSMAPQEDFTAGEISAPERISIRRSAAGRLDGAQIHVLSFLGETWGRGAPRFTAEQAVGWSRKIAEAGGVMTWDTPTQTNGLISQPFMEQLQVIGKAVRRPAQRP